MAPHKLQREENDEGECGEQSDSDKGCSEEGWLFTQAAVVLDHRRVENIFFKHFQVRQTELAQYTRSRGIPTVRNILRCVALLASSSDRTLDIVSFACLFWFSTFGVIR